MDNYPYSEKMVKDLDAILDVLKNRVGQYYHISFISDKPPFVSDKQYAEFRVKSAIRILSERDLVSLDEHESPMIMRAGLDFFDEGGFSKERVSFLEKQEKELAEIETRRKLQETQLADLKAKLEMTDQTIAQLEAQMDFFKTSIRRNRIQIIFFYVSLLISIISVLVVLSK